MTRATAGHVVLEHLELPGRHFLAVGETAADALSAQGWRRTGEDPTTYNRDHTRYVPPPPPPTPEERAERERAALIRQAEQWVEDCRREDEHLARVLEHHKLPPIATVAAKLTAPERAALVAAVEMCDPYEHTGVYAGRLARALDVPEELRLPD